MQTLTLGFLSCVERLRTPYKGWYSEYLTTSLWKRFIQPPCPSRERPKRTLPQNELCSFHIPHPWTCQCSSQPCYLISPFSLVDPNKCDTFSLLAFAVLRIPVYIIMSVIWNHYVHAPPLPPSCELFSHLGSRSCEPYAILE